MTQALVESGANVAILDLNGRHTIFPSGVYFPPWGRARERRDRDKTEDGN
jgi:hypothetical protein